MTLHLPNPNPGPRHRNRPVREKPVLVPTFQPTPVDDCGAEMTRDHWCRRSYPCPEHGGE